MAFVKLKSTIGNFIHFNLSLATTIKLDDRGIITIKFGSEEHYEVLHYQQDDYCNIDIVQGFLNQNI